MPYANLFRFSSERPWYANNVFSIFSLDSGSCAENKMEANDSVNDIPNHSGDNPVIMNDIPAFIETSLQTSMQPTAFTDAVLNVTPKVSTNMKGKLETFCLP